eukprot:EG_transcript_6536
MAQASVATPRLAVVAPEHIDDSECVTGTVVMGRHEERIRILLSQLRSMTVIKPADRRSLRITTHLAKGTLANVYQVWEEDSGRSSALKVIPVESVNADSLFANIETLKALDHPNIVQYRSHFIHHVDDVRCLCIELEFCSNGTLAGYLRAKAHYKGGLPAAMVHDFASQLAAALGFIHDQGLLHGDLRPQNVLVTTDKKLKLTNFGSPLRVDGRGGLCRTITGGCIAYAPPEWMDSQSPHRALQPWERPLPSYDMWSLGCLLSEIVTLKLLMEDRHYKRSALAADPEGLQEVAEEVGAAHGGQFSGLLGRLLDRDADARLSARETQEAVQGLRPKRHGLHALHPRRLLLRG